MQQQHANRRPILLCARHASCGEQAGSGEHESTRQSPSGTRWSGEESVCHECA
jgi:hypothetical protein